MKGPQGLVHDLDDGDYSEEEDAAPLADADTAAAANEETGIDGKSSLALVASQSMEDLWLGMIDFLGSRRQSAEAFNPAGRGHRNLLLFCPLRRDPCLTEQFVAFVRKEKAAHDAATAAAAHAGAAAHAVLSAAKKLADLEEFLRSVQSGIAKVNPDWRFLYRIASIHLST